MLMIIQANGAALQTDMTLTDFQALIVSVAPSPWITITESVLGSIILNVFTVSYYYYQA